MPANPAKDAPPPVAYGRLLANGALLLILAVEGGVLLLSHPSWMNRITGILALFASVLMLAQMIFNFVFQFVSEEFKARTRTLLQSPRLTLILGIAVLLVAGPSVTAARQIQSPLLLVLPAPGNVFNSFAQATGEGDDYFLEVRQDGKLLSRVNVTGKGSIVVGPNAQVRAETLDDKLKDKQKEEMGKKTDYMAIKNKWTDPGSRFFVNVDLQSGCVRLDLTDPKDAGRHVISRQWVRLDSNPQLVFLEDKIDIQGCGS